MAKQTEQDDFKDSQDKLLLGRYRLLEEAGSGGYATVQLAWDTRIQRRVAVKCIQLEGADPELLQQLQEQDATWENVPGLEEARTAAMLNHPNIVTVYDFAVEDETAYLFMEYVDGLTLSETLKAAGDAMNLDMVATVFSDVSQALAYAHENQVLHLDIKPDNVLIDRKGQVKVSDFGLATLSSSNGFGSAAGGTIGYMPPEQIRLQQLDDRCDEWALASLTYEMISGSNPFQVNSLGKAAEAIEDAEIALPSLCMEGLTEQADDILFYALDPDRDERYDSVEEFAEEFQRHLGDAAKGRKQLAKLVQAACSDDIPEEQGTTIMTHIGPLSSRGEAVLTRVWAAAGTIALGYIALSYLDVLGGWDNTVSLGVFLAVVMASIIMPSIGVSLGLMALGAALFVSGAYVPGVLLVGLPPIWWWTTARHNPFLSCASITPALAGFPGFSSVVPLVVGLCGNVRGALTCSSFAVLVAFFLAGFGSADLLSWQVGIGAYSGRVYGTVLLGMLANVSFWITAASWILASLATAALCSKGTRGWALLGIICGFVVLTLGAVGVAAFESAAASLVPATNVIGALAGSLAVGLVLVPILYPAAGKR